ncbi:MAG: hypothetical protein WAV76_16325 [Bacteroidota bacterium]
MNKHIIWAVVVVLAAAVSFFIGKSSSTQALQVTQAEVDKLTIEKAVKQSFPGAEKHEITLDEAKKLIEGHGKKEGGMFNRAIIEKILAQPRCGGLHYYFGFSQKEKKTIVLFGIDTSTKELLTGTIANTPFPCPPDCPGPKIFEK